MPAKSTAITARPTPDHAAAEDPRESARRQNPHRPRCRHRRRPSGPRFPPPSLVRRPPTYRASCHNSASPGVRRRLTRISVKHLLMERPNLGVLLTSIRRKPTSRRRCRLLGVDSPSSGHGSQAQLIARNRLYLFTNIPEKTKHLTLLFQSFIGTAKLLPWPMAHSAGLRQSYQPTLLVIRVLWVWMRPDTIHFQTRGIRYG